jgi:tRNA A-37 threonylcarbamoyl transferase component Bud32
MKGTVSSKHLELAKFIDESISNFDSQGIVLYEGRNVVKVFDLSGMSINIKRFKKPNLVNSFAYRFVRKSKAQRSFEYARILLEKGIETPDPIAYFENYSSTNFKYSYYVAAHFNADFTYRELIHDGSIENREDILRQYTRFVHKMHEAGVYFMDNSPGNTLIAMDGKIASFFLVDLNRMKFYDIPYEDRLKNFERLSPEKWMYEIMGDEYAILLGKNSKEVIEKMWNYTQQFQEKFHRKKELKKKLKAFFK